MQRCGINIQDFLHTLREDNRQIILRHALICKPSLRHRMLDRSNNIQQQHAAALYFSLQPSHAPLQLIGHVTNIVCVNKVAAAVKNCDGMSGSIGLVVAQRQT
jgi:hypothetical protein